MGRGDRRTRKGKIFLGSYGNSRPHREETADKVAASTTTAKKTKTTKKS